MQLTVMSLAPGEDIGWEMHDHLDQFLRIEQGQGRLRFGRTEDHVDEEHTVGDDWGIIVPAGHVARRAQHRRHRAQAVLDVRAARSTRPAPCTARRPTPRPTSTTADRSARRQPHRAVAVEDPVRVVGHLRRVAVRVDEDPGVPAPRRLGAGTADGRPGRLGGASTSSTSTAWRRSGRCDAARPPPSTTALSAARWSRPAPRRSANPPGRRRCRPAARGWPTRSPRRGPGAGDVGRIERRSPRHVVPSSDDRAPLYIGRMTSIDLNSDLGESFGVWRLGDDEALLEVVTSANVACGFHAGDPSTLRAVCTAAVANHVTIGAQVGVSRTSLGFGRRYIDIDPRDLRDAVLYQLGALDAFAQVAGSEVAYVKPHGALYHATIGDPAQADAVVAAAAEYDPSLAVLGAPGSLLLRARRGGRAGAGRRGLRRPGLPPRRPPRPALGAGRPRHRAGRGRRHGRCAWRPSTRCVAVDGSVVGRRGPLAVRARRHAGRRRAGPGGPRRARRRRRRPSTRSPPDAAGAAVRAAAPGWSRPTATPSPSAAALRASAPAEHRSTSWPARRRCS